MLFDSIYGTIVDKSNQEQARFVGNRSEQQRVAQKAAQMAGVHSGLKPIAFSSGLWKDAIRQRQLLLKRQPLVLNKATRSS